MSFCHNNFKNYIIKCGLKFKNKRNNIHIYITYIPAYNIHIHPWIKNKNYTTVSLKRDQNWTLTVNKSIVYFCISCISDTNAFIPAGLGDGETPTFWIRFEKKYYSFHPDQQFWFIQLDLALAFRSYPVDEETICAIRPCTC